MNKLKKIKSETKIVSKHRGGDCEQYPVFSFQYLTTSKHYNFNYFSDHERKNMESTKVDLYNRLEEISQISWQDWLLQRRYTGLEKISFSRLHFGAKNIKLAPDESIYVFRFDHQDKRILGFRKDKCPIYYIIGYDFDHSAYDHGS